MLPSRSFRLVCAPDTAAGVESLLEAEGFAFSPEPFHPLARRLVHEPFPLGSSLAAAFGYIYIQDRSSMLPPLVLAPKKGDAVLDMCASPGSKTGMLGQMTGPEGFVLGNEPSRNRLATLRRNLQTLNLIHCATCSYSGEALPFASGSWSAIQLDPPCSGWGTADKHPGVMALWQGEKVEPLILLQRKLLGEAERLLAPGGRLVYSTCTTNTRENEEQLAFAVDELGLDFVPVEAPPGFQFADLSLPRFAGALKVENGPDGQGFFVALLQKKANGRAGEHESALQAGAAGPAHFGAQGEAQDEPEGAAGGRGARGKSRGAPCNDAGGAFFVRPWEKESRYVGERRRHGGRKERDGASAEILSRAMLDDLYADSSLLPPGDIAVFNGQAHFLPEAGAAKIPAGFVWKAFPLGKTGRDGRLRLSSRLRCLMPGPDAARERGLAVLDVEDITPLLALCKGQSLTVDAQGPEAGLYYRGLPLCRLAVKGRRAVLPV